MPIQYLLDAYDIPNVLGKALLLQMVGYLDLKLQDDHFSLYLPPLERYIYAICVGFPTKDSNCCLHGPAMQSLLVMT